MAFGLQEETDVRDYLEKKGNVTVAKCGKNMRDSDDRREGRDDGEMTEKIRAKIIGGQEDARGGLKRKAGYDGEARKGQDSI